MIIVPTAGMSVEIKFRQNAVSVKIKTVMLSIKQYNKSFADPLHSHSCLISGGSVKKSQISSLLWKIMF